MKRIFLYAIINGYGQIFKSGGIHDRRLEIHDNEFDAEQACKEFVGGGGLKTYHLKSIGGLRVVPVEVILKQGGKDE